ncbi:MAG: hypothetical protein QJR02_10815, partial [Sinobacteraceae bacterium]|nr:hypothetical protein [Nevskiaceae bacterium]
GFRDSRDFETARRLMTSLEIVELGGRDIAVQAAKNQRRLRALGFTPRNTLDTIIATRCIVDGHALLFSGRDFVPFVKHLALKSAL